MPLSKIKSTGIDDNSVTSAKILNGTIVNADVNACAAIANTKLSGVVTSAEANVASTSDVDQMIERSQDTFDSDGKWSANSVYNEWPTPLD